MKSCFHAVVTVALGLALAAPMVAESQPPGAAAAADPSQGAAPASDPSAMPEAGDETASAAPASGDPASAGPQADGASRSAAAHQTVLGPRGRDDQGRTGRLHTVVSGDTLWDISDAYLGTPWVWPSIWHDNAAVSNPHLIHPGDILWITPEEMRPVSDAEAAELLAAEDGSLPAAMEVDGMPGEGAERPTFNFAAIQTAGFVSDEALEGSATIVDSPTERWMLGENDRVVIGLGGGKVAQGDRFEIFRTEERVRDIEGQPIGWETHELGWLEVTEVHAESATAVIRLSRAEMQRGDRVRPLVVREPDIEILSAPEVEGFVLHTPDDRLDMATHDVVYIDRGMRDGLAVGSPLEIYRPLGRGVDAVTGPVELPDEVVAKLLVVVAEEETAVALVTHAVDDLGRGDRFRGSADIAH